MALLFILDDEVVKLSPHARAIRDVEDEELRGFFYGMSAWQFILVVTASSIGEELFYRAAFQGALADIFLRGTNLISYTRGMVALTGLLPPFVPFAQVFAATITAALTGSLYYIAASPKDPTYIMAPVLKTRSARDELKKLFAAWFWVYTSASKGSDKQPSCTDHHTRYILSCCTRERSVEITPSPAKTPVTCSEA